MFSPLSRSRGVLLGHLIGDSLGSRYEFMDGNEVKEKMVSDVQQKSTGMLPILGEGPFGFKAGEATDDGELTLSLVGILLERRGYEKEYVACAYERWSETDPMDIGQATRSAQPHCALTTDWMTILSEADVKEVYSQVLSNTRHFNSHSESNGCLARICPLPVYYRNGKVEGWMDHCSEDALLTHSAPPVVCAVKVYCRAIHDLINGESREDVYRNALDNADDPLIVRILKSCEIKQDPLSSAPILSILKDEKDTRIRVMGISLQLAFHQLLHSTDFTSGLIDVIKIGGDTDTNGCITGALLGAIYSDESIPKMWIDTVTNAKCRLSGENGITTVTDMIERLVGE